MSKLSENTSDAKLDEIIDLLRQLVAIEMYRGKVPKAAIGKRLRLGKEKIAVMLGGFEDWSQE